MRLKLINRCERPLKIKKVYTEVSFFAIIFIVMYLVRSQMSQMEAARPTLPSAHTGSFPAYIPQCALKHPFDQRNPLRS